MPSLYIFNTSRSTIKFSSTGKRITHLKSHLKRLSKSSNLFWLCWLVLHANYKSFMQHFYCKNIVVRQNKMYDGPYIWSDIIFVKKNSTHYRQWNLIDPNQFLTLKNSDNFYARHFYKKSCFNSLQQRVENLICLKICHVLKV